MPDFERIDQVMDRLRERPEEHDQSVWGLRRPAADNACQTTCCMAGTTVLMFAPERVEWVPVLVDPQGRVLEWRLYSTEEEAGGVSDIAAELLGLDDHGKELLFYDSHNLKELEQGVQRLQDEAVQGLAG